MSPVWDETAGYEKCGRTATFTRAEAEAWLRQGHRLTASDHEKLETDQGFLWSPGGGLQDAPSSAGEPRLAQPDPGKSKG